MSTKCMNDRSSSNSLHSWKTTNGNLILGDTTNRNKDFVRRRADDYLGRWWQHLYEMYEVYAMKFCFLRSRKRTQMWFHLLRFYDVKCWLPNKITTLWDARLKTEYLNMIVKKILWTCVLSKFFFLTRKRQKWWFYIFGPRQMKSLLCKTQGYILTRLVKTAHLWNEWNYILPEISSVTKEDSNGGMEMEDLRKWNQYVVRLRKIEYCLYGYEKDSKQT